MDKGNKGDLAMEFLNQTEPPHQQFKGFKL